MKKDINQEMYSTPLDKKNIKSLKSLRSPMTRKKFQNSHWSDKVDKAIERYVKWEHKPHIQKRIFREHIGIPLRNVSRSILKKTIFLKRGEKLMEFDPYNDKSWIEDPLFKELKKIDGKEAYDKEIENIVDECVSFFFTTCYPYIRNSILLVNEGEEQTIKSNIGYIRVAIYHYLINLNRERSRNSVGGKYWEELPDQSTQGDYYFELYKKGMVVPSTEKEIDNELIYVNELLDYWDKNIPLIWKRKNQELARTTARNVVELMRRSQKIKHFKVVSMRRYLRKMMGWEKGDNIYNSGKRNTFNDIIMFMKKRNKLLRKQYVEKGYIDFYRTT
tara:strand:+ start:5106 stop:6101 length:996 start_codon:yes stop_codon:yes gene_type:complete